MAFNFETYLSDLKSKVTDTDPGSDLEAIKKEKEQALKTANIDPKKISLQQRVASGPMIDMAKAQEYSKGVQQTFDAEQGSGMFSGINQFLRGNYANAAMKTNQLKEAALTADATRKFDEPEDVLNRALQAGMGVSNETKKMSQKEALANLAKNLGYGPSQMEKVRATAEGQELMGQYKEEASKRLEEKKKQIEDSFAPRIAEALAVKAEKEAKLKEMEAKRIVERGLPMMLESADNTLQNSLKVFGSMGQVGTWSLGMAKATRNMILDTVRAKVQQSPDDKTMKAWQDRLNQATAALSSFRGGKDAVKMATTLKSLGFPVQDYYTRDFLVSNGLVEEYKYY